MFVSCFSELISELASPRELPLHAAHIGAVDVGIAQVGQVQVSKAQVGLPQVDPAQVDPAQVGPDQFGRFQVGPGQVGVARVAGDTTNLSKTRWMELDFQQQKDTTKTVYNFASHQLKH